MCIWLENFETSNWNWSLDLKYSKSENWMFPAKTACGVGTGGHLKQQQCHSTCDRLHVSQTFCTLEIQKRWKYQIGGPLTPFGLQQCLSIFNSANFKTIVSFLRCALLFFGVKLHLCETAEVINTLAWCSDHSTVWGPTISKCNTITVTLKSSNFNTVAHLHVLK